MKKKILVSLIALLGVIVCTHTKANAVNFYDTQGTRYEGAVERLNELGIVDGVSDKVFNAEKTVTRAELAKMLTGALLNEAEFSALAFDDKDCNYTDVVKGEWYYDYVVVASNYGLIQGYEDNTFKPNKEVTYEEAAKMLLKGLGHTYLREDHPNGWATEYLDKMYELRLNKGTTKFEEKESAIRGNIAIMIWNMLTNNAWEKVELNDKTGFTFVDSGRTLFSKKFSDEYGYLNNVEIKGVMEQNDHLFINLGNKYYRILDDDATFYLSMLGGKATALLYKIKDKKGNVREEAVIGVSSDIGMQLYEGTLEELKNDGFSYGTKTYKIGSSADYGYLIYNDSEDTVERVVTFNSQGERYFIDEIEIKIEKLEEDDDDLEEDEGQEDTIIKTIIINDEEKIINDGAVLFYNNKRVDWETAEEGDIITEIKSGSYYILTKTSKEIVISGAKKESNKYIIETEKGDLDSYTNTKCVEYLSNNPKKLNTISEANMEKMIGKTAKVYLDFAGKIVRIEFLEKYEETEIVDTGIAYFYSFNIRSEETGSMNYLTVVVNGEKQTYRTALKNIPAEKGDLVIINMSSNGRNVEKVSKVESSAEINGITNIKKVDYDDLTELIEIEAIKQNIPIYQTTYEYDFGEYEKLIDFETKRTTLDNIKELSEEEIEIYAVTDALGNIQNIFVNDFSQKIDTFYGKVDNIYTEDSKLRIEISVIQGKTVDYEISGLVNCEEGDFVSFKIVNKNEIRIQEKYSVSALGYYKDIVVGEAGRDGVKDAEGKSISINEGRLIIGESEYDLKEFTVISMRINKGLEGEWLIGQVKKLEEEDIELQSNDRIAINEIEDTIIIYRGYSE